MTATFLVLPPSEGKQAGGRGTWEPGSGRFGSALAEARSEIIDRVQRHVRAAKTAELSRFFGVSGAHLERAVANVVDGIVGAPALPARDRYTGVVWGHLDLASLEQSDRRWCAGHIVVVSGLLGFVAAGDPTPDYRLKMAARLPQIGLLAHWWKPKLAAVAKSAFARARVVDLLPNEHAAAFSPDALAGSTVRVRFKSTNGANAAGHAAKAAKGLVARAIVSNRDRSPAEVCQNFWDGGFRFRSTSISGTAQEVLIVAEAY